MPRKYARTTHVLPFLVTALLAVLPGCGSTMLLDKDIVKQISAPPDVESHVVFCTDDFTYTPDGKLLEKKYVVTRVGTNAAEFKRRLEVNEDANVRIDDIEGRVLHADGSSTRIPPGAFYRVNLSDEQRIAEEYVRAAPITDRLATGDLVEIVSLVEHGFPQLGIGFSPAGLGYPSDNVTCSIVLPPGQDIQYEVMNANVVPEIRNDSTGKKYTFTWPSYRAPSKEYYPMLVRNPWPRMLAAPATQTWVSFGDWYLDLVREKLAAGQALADTTARIVAGKATAREKMDAIFDYCQRAIRYEQMFLANGEFIPNAADVIFARRFGDCKDYATLMHAMASSAGISTDLVLCYRGRGRNIVEKVPVSQFNHVILHYSDSSRDCWYDATDRLGLHGTPSFDLANARGLIVEKGRSRLATIEESPKNLAVVSGKLALSSDNELRGMLTVSFRQQYAVGFSWEQEHENAEKMRTSLTQDLKSLLNDDLVIDSLAWSGTRDAFTVTMRCSIPNGPTTLGDKMYIAPSRVFPNLLPDDMEKPELQRAFFFPYLNRLSMDVTVAGMADPLRLQYQLPAGPFDDATRPAFLSQLAQVHAAFMKPIICKRITNQ